MMLLVSCLVAYNVNVVNALSLSSLKKFAEVLLFRSVCNDRLN